METSEEDTNRTSVMQIQGTSLENILFDNETEANKNDQMGSHLLTYKKRKGTENHGKEYEYVMCAYYALKFSLSENVVDFKMSTNNEMYGDFDDAEITVTFSDNSTHTFLIQLKHSLEEKGLTEKMLTAEKDNFSLAKYLKSFKDINSRENITCILLTNRKSQLKNGSNILLPHGNIKREVTVKPYQPKNINHLLVNTAEESEDTCFRFELHQNQDSPEEVIEFFRKFCLFTNQVNVKRSQSFIKETLNKLFGYNIDFVSFMQCWWTNRFVLTKHDVIAKLAELALSPYIQEIAFKTTKPISEKSKVLKNAIEKFDMTLVREWDIYKIKQLWRDSLVETDTTKKVSLKYGLSVTNDQSKVLWYLTKVPLVVKYDEDAKVRILGAVKLLEAEKNKMKIILWGNHSREEFDKWKVFENLYDLQMNEESYKEVIETFKVSLQGRTSIKLKHLIAMDVEIGKDIKTNELFQMLDEDLSMGQSLADLPEAYISRTISTVFLDTKQVLNYYINTGNDLLIMICNPEMKNVIVSRINNSQNKDKPAKRKTLEIKEIDDPFMQKSFCTTQGSKTLLLSTNKSLAIKEFEEICARNPQLNTYLLQIIDEECCALVSSQGNITSLNEIKQLNKQIREDELVLIFINLLNVVIGKPGIGKSTLFTFLSQQCPPDCWCIRINLIEYNSVFKEKLDHDAILDRILEKEIHVSGKILGMFKTSKRLYLLLDGLDEIDSDCIKDVLEFIKHVSNIGIKVWLSSREHLKEQIQRQLNVVPIEIQELTETEQRNYICERLLSKEYSENEIENITSEIFKSVSINYNAKRLLGIPLQLYIITEIFRRQRQIIECEEDFFVLSKIYRRFFYGKYEHQQAKAGIKYEEAFDDDLDLILKQYELPALRACLDDETFNKLRLKNTKLEKSRSFLEKFKRKGNKLGIISQVVGDEAIFCHQSFAEYFACRWLERNVDKLYLIKNDFFNDKYQNLRLIFDIMSAEDHPLHLSTIYKNPDQVKKFNRPNNKKDKRGRSALHIICSYSELLSLDSRNEDETLPVLEILKLILLNEDPSEKDELFNWDCLEYALHSKTLLPFDIISKVREDVNIDDLFRHFRDNELVHYCSRFGYSYLLSSIVKKRPNIINETDENFVWQAVRKCVESKEESFRHQFLQTIKILANNGCDLNRREKTDFTKSCTPIHYACIYGNYDIIDTLSELGSDINAVDTENSTVLHVASTNNKPEIIEYLISKGLNVSQVDANNWTPLHYACRYGTCEVLEILLKRGSDINAVVKENATVLHLASMNDKPEIVEYLIEKGMPINQTDINNLTPLHYASGKSNCDVMEILLRNGADINAVTNENATMLHLASTYDKPEIVEYLIDKGLRVNQVDIENRTPLHYACESSSCDVMVTLLKNGADINAVTNEYATVLHLASMYDKPEIVEYLVRKGIQVNEADINNRIPLHYACEKSSCDVIEILLKNGSAINAVTFENATALHLASMNDKPEVVEYLLEKGMQINQVDMNNWTPLHYACRQGNCDVIEALLGNGSDINAVTSKNETVLHLASMNNKPEIVKYFISKGMQVNQVTVNKWTPLHYACHKSSCEIIDILLSNGSDINAVTDEHETVLHLAAVNDKPEIIEYLMEKGMKLDQVDINNWTPLHYACQYGTCNVIETLVERGFDINAVTNEDATMLHLASANTKPEVIAYLIKKGMKVDQVNVNKWTPLHYACRYSTCDVIDTLLENGCDVNAVANENVTLLHVASMNNKPEIIEYLIKKGMEVNQVDMYQWTPLHYACLYGSCDVIEALLNNGADSNAVTDENETVLVMASRNKNVNVMKLLLKGSVNIWHYLTLNALGPKDLWFATCNLSSSNDINIFIMLLVLVLWEINRFINKTL